MVTTIKLMPDTPPPPPPPPKEPPKEQPKEMKVVQPMPQVAPQPSEQVNMKGPTGNAPSPFGAGDVTKDYNGGKIGGNSRFKGYLNGLERNIRDELSRNEKLRKGEFKAVVAIWLGHSGIVERFELIGSSGDPDVDAAMKKVLSSIKQFDEPPLDMPQPVKLRISSR